MTFLAELICDTAENLLFEYATKRGDGFRQWYYPNLPASYRVNPLVKQLVEEGMRRGQSAQQIADEIYHYNS